MFKEQYYVTTLAHRDFLMSSDLLLHLCRMRLFFNILVDTFDLFAACV